MDGYDKQFDFGIHLEFPYEPTCAKFEWQCYSTFACVLVVSTTWNEKYLNVEMLNANWITLQLPSSDSILIVIKK